MATQQKVRSSLTTVGLAAALIQHVTDRATLEDLATSGLGRGDVILVSIGQFMGMS